MHCDEIHNISSYPEITHFEKYVVRNMASFFRHMFTEDPKGITSQNIHTYLSELTEQDFKKRKDFVWFKWDVSTMVIPMSLHTEVTVKFTFEFTENIEHIVFFKRAL